MRGLLIVDGGINLAAALAEYLGYEGFDAFPVHNENEAVELLKSGMELPQAILIDIDTTSKGGGVLLPALKNTAAWTGIPVIAVRDQGKGKTPDIDQARHVMKKPVSMPDLVMVLTHYCRRSA